MSIVIILLVSSFLCPAFAVTYRTAPAKKYVSEKVCWETYGTTLNIYDGILHKGNCGLKCTEWSECQSFLYNIEERWCSLNSDVLLNKKTSGCPYLVDYAEISTRNTIRHIQPPTHCGPVPSISSIEVDKSSGNYSVGAEFPYSCRPCTYFPPDTSPGVITCGTDGKWIIPSDLCVYGPDVGYLKDGSPIPASAVGCGVKFNDTCPYTSVQSGLLLNGTSGICYCDVVCCSQGDCCFDSTCNQDYDNYNYYYNNNNNNYYYNNY